MTAHRINYRTRYGADQVIRLFGAPDCDAAAMYVLSQGGTVKRVEAVDADAPRVWGEDFIAEGAGA